MFKIFNPSDVLRIVVCSIVTLENVKTVCNYTRIDIPDRTVIFSSELQGSKNSLSVVGYSDVSVSHVT